LPANFVKPLIDPLIVAASAVTPSLASAAARIHHGDGAVLA
jgi:hypothetical protein